MRFKKFLLAATFVALAGFVNGQDPAYIMNIADGSVSDGGSGTLAVTMDNNGSDVAGWSYGACNDTALLTCEDAVDGATTATVQNGTPPGFNQIGIFADGFTVGVVICFTGCAVLAPGTDYELNVATYSGIAEGSTEVAFCDTLGSPAVATVVVVDGASIVPTQNSGSVNVVGVPDPEYTFSAGEASANYNPGDGEASTSVDFGITETDNSGLGAPFPNDTQGFSMGVSNSEEVSPTAVNVSLPFEPGFAESSMFDNGWTIGVVYSFTGAFVLAFPEETAVVSVDYATNGSMAGNEAGATASLTWSDDLGSPAVANVTVVGGGSYTPSYDDGSITLNPVVTSDYIRGDANSDERVNIADGVWIISELFLGGAVSTCPIARDSNNDGQVDAADAVYIFQYRFLDGPQPEAPFPSCGQTDGQTPEDCADSGCGGGGTAPVTFANDIQPILTAACAPCHTPGGAQGNGPSAGLQLTENAYDNLVDVPAGQCDQLNLVHSGDRASSWLYRKVAGSHTEADVLDIGCCPDTDGDGAPDGCGRRMPRFCENSQSCLDGATLELIGTWIDEGAL